MKVAVVILNWNGRDLLEKFLPPVVKFSGEATVYVADNASTDGSVNFIAENFPTVKILRNKTNGGYARGYNEALQHLSEDIFVLLNSDVAVTEGWLQPVLSVFRTNPAVAAAQPKILDYHNRQYFEYAGAAGGFLDSFGYPYCRGRIFNTVERDRGQYDGVAEIFWASGACLFVRRDAFWKAGALDTDYFAHQEEIDLCWRLRAQGGQVVCVGGASVYHVGGATLASQNPKKTFYNFRNSLLNLLKNVHGPAAYTAIFIRLVLDGAAGIQFLLQGKPAHFLAILRAHGSFYGLFFSFLPKRKKYASKLVYFKTKSIVFQYFIKKKRRFTHL